MDSETKNSTKKQKRPFLTTLGILFVFLLVLLIGAWIVPPVALRYVFSRIETQTGITITFDKAYLYLADGSFLYIKGLAAKRHHHPASNFDLKADWVQMPAMFPADFYSPVLLISGLRGTIERVGSDPADNSERQENKEETVETAPETTPISALMLMDTEITFIDRTLGKLFETTIQIEKFAASKTDGSALFAPYVCGGTGKISTAPFAIAYGLDDYKQQIELAEIPFNFLAPYAPVLDDIFASGSMRMRIDELPGETLKQLHVSIWLQPDCKIKPANEILAPTIQTALRQLDQSSVSELQDVQKKIERLKTFAESLHNEVDKHANLVGAIMSLAPRDVREKYENVKNQYDRARAAYDESNTKFETLLRELDQIKIRIIEDTFQAFINSGIPIEIDLQEVNGEWQYDGYAVVTGLIERNYQTLLTTEYQRRIQEIRDAVDRLLVP